MSANNGGNPRLDRIEKLIEQSALRNEQAHQRSHARMDRIERNLDRFEKNLDRGEKRLSRAIAFGVKEALNQRKRAAELDRKWDKKMDQLASAQLLTEQGLKRLEAAQLVTEEMLKRFLSSRGRNGHS